MNNNNNKMENNMRPHSQNHLSLTQIIEKHLQSLKNETGVSMGTFVANVREHYESSVAFHSQTIEWSKSTDHFERMRMDAEKLNRWIGLNITKPLSVDLLESIIAAFPDDRRFTLQMELAARQNMLAVPMPRGIASEDGAHLGRIAKETGEAMIAIAKLFDDGAINSKDKANAPQAIDEINQAIAVLAAMKAVIESKALGKSPSLIFDTTKA